MRHASAAALAAVTIALAGCGGDDPVPTSPTAARPGTAAKAPANPADARLARAALLKLTDFPEGWTRDDPDDDGPDPLKCPDVTAARAEAAVRSKGGGFSFGDATFATDVSLVFADSAAAERWQAKLNQSPTRKCLGEGLSKWLDDRDGVEAGEPSTGLLNVTQVADRVSASRINMTVSIEGQDVEFYVDYLLIRRGRTLSLLTLVDVLTEFDSDVRSTLVKAISDNIGAAETSS